MKSGWPYRPREIQSDEICSENAFSRTNAVKKWSLGLFSPRRTGFAIFAFYSGLSARIPFCSTQPVKTVLASAVRSYHRRALGSWNHFLTPEGIFLTHLNEPVY